MACATLALACLCLSLARIGSAQPLQPISGVQQLAVGDSHACVLLTGGAVKCWGSNSMGQLGDGSTTHRHLPANVSGLSSGVTAISAGYRHSCALLSDGTVKCWGKNLLHQLGDGTNTMRTTPVDVSGLTGATAITTGGDHSCALIGLAGLKCWGYNGYGELGTGNTDNQSTPANVIGGQNLLAISAGYSHTCALTTSNTVKCWGVRDRVCNSFGCAFDYIVTPATVTALGNDIATISAGQHFNCALTTGGAVKCWGDNYDDQLGDLPGTEVDPNNPDPLTPFPISGLDSGVTHISAGYRHACARRANGSLRCWGYNGSGRLGDGSSTSSPIPVVVSGLTNATSVGSGGNFSCARTSSGGVKCWGSNDSGQMGDNDPWIRNEPVDVVGLGSGVKSIATGEFHSCAVTASGAVKCWGDNAHGQLGNGSSAESNVPVDVTGLSSGASMVSAGLGHSCAVAAGGAVRCWGANDWGQLGDSSYDPSGTPVSTNGLASGVNKVEVGDHHSCARRTSGPPQCWGLNIDSQLGDASFSGAQPAPVTVVNLATGVADISAGGAHSCAAVPDGRIACWGDNGDAQIGDGGFDTAHVPAVLPFPSQGTTAVSAGGSHSCAIAAGRVYCWGDNSHGQGGFGFTSGNVNQPGWIQSLGTGSTAISAGQNHSCAVASGGQAFCWGENGQGQLGDGSATDRSAPAAVVGLGAGTSQISAGTYHSCAISTGGNVKCWGYNAQGQLGIGGRDHRLPGDVLDDPAFFRDGFESP